MRILAISDIHGCLATFKALLKQINFSKADHLFLVGDYVDRGPNSKGVIDQIWRLQALGYTITCLKGNHEELILEGYRKGQDNDLWLQHGGKATLASFKTKNARTIPTKYIDWMENLPHSIIHESYIFVHAGLNFDLPDPFEGKNSMLWIRNWYENINYPWLGDRIIIHGHTPTRRKEIATSFQSVNQVRVLDIDAGCVFDNLHRGLGHLCAVDLTNQVLHFKKNIG